ncbi:MAG: hypothetical protein U1E52_11550 [Geminicoccaceae bacterium]
MAIYTLREILQTRPTIDLGDVVLTNFVRDASSTLSPSQVIIETIEGSEPGLIIRTATPLSSGTAQHFGFEFRATADSSIIEGASVTMSGSSFSNPESGGSIDLDVGQAGRDADNLTINLFNDNAAGVADSFADSDTIAGGPVDTFRFDYDLTLAPVSGTATFTTSTLLFDLSAAPPPTVTLPSGFDGLQYIASYADLAAAFGANRTAGEQHYLAFGHSEGRTVDGFSETQYLQNYADLRAAFGTNVQLATQHYIQHGMGEGRSDDAASAAQINGLQYIASHDDLIQAFGANATAGQQHYVNFGQGEGRALDTFDETQYLANYADLRAAFGTNTEAATQHFIQHGFAEGRHDFIV